MKTLNALRALESLPKVPAPVVVGFDGFVDEMISVVAERTSLDDFSSVPDIAAFGGLISAAAGHSSLREIVVNAVHPGGCAVNLGDGLAAMGVPVDCFATLGEPVHPAFREPASLFRLGDGSYQSSCREAAIIALTDWSLYPHMTAVWRVLQHEIYSKLKHRPHFFIDLVDPSSRSQADILAMVETLPFLETSGPVTLGLNGNEANILARLLGLDPAQEEEGCMRLAAELRRKTGVSTIVIHKLKFAVSAGPHGEFSTQGPFCERPIKSTGAGDRFNAGYCLGLLAGAAPEDCLVLGCAVSGFFVRTAQSPSRDEIAKFLSMGL